MVIPLQPFGGRMPTTQQQFDNMFNQLRSMGHVMERSPGNIAAALQPQGQAQRTYMTETFHAADGYTQVPTDNNDAATAMTNNSNFDNWSAQPAGSSGGSRI